MVRAKRFLSGLTALLVALGVVAVGGPVEAATVEPAPVEAAAVEVTGQACAPGVGVTVVVDRHQLGGGVQVGCAPGAQPDGFTALLAAGFSVNDDPGAVAGTVCQIDGQPTAGYPGCWFDGFWGYWKSDGVQPWTWSEVGAGDGPLAVDRVEGWSWTSPIPDDYAGTPIRLTIGEIEALRASPVGTGWSVLSTGTGVTCGVTSTGAAFCWGNDDNGQLGNGAELQTRQTYPSPVVTPTGERWATIAAATRHVCAVTVSGRAYCWGLGALGNTVSDRQAAPFEVEGPDGVLWADVTVGNDHSCGVTTTGRLYCWGNDGAGELGNGPGGGHSATPVPVSGALADRDRRRRTSSRPSGFAAGLGLALRSTAFGAAARPAHLSARAPDDQADGGFVAQAVSAGEAHTCALDPAGEAWCWGSGGNGRTGTGPTTVNLHLPTRVAGGHTWRAVSSGALHGCGLTASGAWCWGSDGQGRLGNGEPMADTDSPVEVGAPAGGGWELLALGAHSCGIASGAQAYCWGHNADGHLAVDGPVGGVTSPLPVRGGHRWASIDPGWSSTCGTTIEGAALCWGSAVFGALGTGQTSGIVTEPTRVAALGQTLTFDEMDDVRLGVAPIATGAAATSGLAVELVAHGPCAAEATTVVATGVGVCTVVATQGGDGAWAPAVPVTRSFEIRPYSDDEIAPVLTLTAVPGDYVPVEASTSTATVAITYEVDDPTAVVQYRLDGGAWLAADSPLVISGLAPGPHGVSLRARDAAGNSHSVAVAWKVVGPRDCTVGPELPDLGIIDHREVLPVHQADGHRVEVAVLTDLDATATDADFAERDTVSLAAHLGQRVRVVARVVDDTCAAPHLFDATYDVRGAYAPRWDLTDVPGAPSPAIAHDDPTLVGWPSAFENYQPGPNVTERWKNPSSLVGKGGLLPLGDRGRIDLVFDRPVYDGDGPDLAVFENGFAIIPIANELDFLELGRVSVSTDGVHWATFDTATRQDEVVSSYGGMRADRLGGLAGKDLDGRGTPFDLTNLKNRPEVRSGLVDLQRITRVRVTDVVGDPDDPDLDSFGRPLYNPYGTYDSGGMDLGGVAALHGREDVDPPRAAHEAWVWAAYEDFLGRSPSSSELSAAVGRLDSGVARSVLARELAQSDEWITHVVTDFYTDTLGRNPSASEVEYWAGELRSGRRSVAQVAASFYGSPEYFGGIGGGTNSAWITDLYGKLLGRSASVGDVDYWSSQVIARGRGWVALQMFQSLESRRARVEDLYQELLGRSADAAGRDYWAGRLTAEGDIASARSLAASPEYLARAQVRFP